jgi:hypothetical protein
MSLVDAAWWVWSQLLSPDTPYEADEVSEALVLKAGVMDMINPETSQQYLRGAEGCTLQASMVEGVEVRGVGVMDMINPKTSQQYLRGAEGCTLQAIMVEGAEVRAKRS